MKVVKRRLGFTLVAAVILVTSQAHAAKAKSMQISLVQAYNGCGGFPGFDTNHAPPMAMAACTVRPTSGNNFGGNPGGNIDALSFGPLGVFTLRFDATGNDIKISWAAKDVLNYGGPFTGTLRATIKFTLTANACGPDFTTPCTAAIPPYLDFPFDIACDGGICKGKTTFNTFWTNVPFFKPALINGGQATTFEIRDVAITDRDNDVAFYQGILIR